MRADQMEAERGNDGRLVSWIQGQIDFTRSHFENRRTRDSARVSFNRA
jgi:hypothetical protein